MNSQKGAALVAFLSTLPALLGILAIIFALLLTYYYFDQTQHRCRSHLLQAQAEIKDHWIQLESLNPSAQSLRRQRQLAEKNLRLAIASGQPPAIVAAKSALALIIGQQQILRQRQQIILNQIAMLAQKHQMSFRRQFLNYTGVRIRKPPRFGLAVTPNPPLDLTPDYKPVPLFSKQQASTARLQISFKSLMPNWLNSWIPHSLPLEGLCSATLEKRQGKWIARLNEVR